MPEGPEIRRAADEIEKAIAHQPVTELFFAFERLKPYEAILQGQRVLQVQTKGKGMLICFDNDLSIYSHNQLYGKWVIRRAHSYPKTNRQLRLALHTAKKSALLYSASEIDVLTPEQVAIHPFLSQLGLDVLDPSITVEQVRDRLLSKPFHRRSFSSLLLDQRFLAGLGNYLRSDILFVARLHPALRPIDCDEAEIDRLAQAILFISRQSYQTGGITNDLELVARLKQQSQRRFQYRHAVYNREGMPCYRCGRAIEKIMTGGRAIYFCPHCQSQ